jgi:6-phosphogluconolactonase
MELFFDSPVLFAPGPAIPPRTEPSTSFALEYPHMRSCLTLIISSLALAACGESSSLPTAPNAPSFGTPASARFDVGARDDGAHGDGARGAVFTQTNGIGGNAIVAFARAADGSLTNAGTFPTDGKGIGGTTDPLASQYSVLLGGDDARLLIVANAGSNDVSVFRVDGAKLKLVGTTPSGGTLPTSLAVSRHTLYVLNAASNTVNGFRMDARGHLVAEPRASARLSTGAAGAAAVRASRDGKFLVVTEKGSRTIDVFPIGHHGALGAAVSSASSGVSPFGFDFVKANQIAVSEAGSAAASLYDIRRNGMLGVESPSVSTNGQAAPCWLIATRNGKFAYTANAGSGTISGYAIDAHGAMQLLVPSGVSGTTGAGSTPLDLDLSSGDHFLYVLESGAGRIGAFAVGPNGSLTSLAGAGGLVPGSGYQGLAAY